MMAAVNFWRVPTQLFYMDFIKCNYLFYNEHLFCANNILFRIHCTCIHKYSKNDSQAINP